MMQLLIRWRPVGSASGSVAAGGAAAGDAVAGDVDALDGAASTDAVDDVSDIRDVCWVPWWWS